MKKICVLFPGQGSQYSGMAKDLYEKDTFARRIIDEVDQTKISHFKEAMFLENNPLLNQTKYTQFAVFLHSVLLYRQFLSRFPYPLQAMVGFSLGEYSALAAGDVLELDEVLDLLSHRVKWMEEASLKHPGGMVAVIGANLDELASYCEKSPQELVIANHNSAQQVVVSGTNQALETFLSDFPAKRKIKLAVSGAFHSPLMEEAALQLKAYVEKKTIRQPRVPIYLNATAKPLQSHHYPIDVYHHTIKGVLFRQTIETLLHEGFDTFIEIGPGQVLTNLIKKMAPEVFTKAIQTINELETWEEESWILTAK